MLEMLNEANPKALEIKNKTKKTQSVFLTASSKHIVFS